MPRGQNPKSKQALENSRILYNRDSAVRAAKKSVEVRRQKKTFREEFETELAAILKDSNGKETTVKNAITKTAVQKALRGDLRAIEFIRDTVGEKPAENIVLFEADPAVITEIEMMVYESP